MRTEDDLLKKKEKEKEKEKELPSPSSFKKKEDLDPITQMEEDLLTSLDYLSRLNSFAELHFDKQGMSGLPHFARKELRDLMFEIANFVENWDPDS